MLIFFLKIKRLKHLFLKSETLTLFPSRSKYFNGRELSIAFSLIRLRTWLNLKLPALSLYCNVQEKMNYHKFREICFTTSGKYYLFLL